MDRCRDLRNLANMPEITPLRQQKHASNSTQAGCEKMGTGFSHKSRVSSLKNDDFGSTRPKIIVIEVIGVISVSWTLNRSKYFAQNTIFPA